jgi:nucleoside-diphosphate-sugar epimerase
LRADGHRVRVLDILDADDRPPDVEFVRADVRDAAAVKAALVDCEVVHNNVALVPLARDKEAFWTVNRDGTRNVLEAALQQGVRKFVHMSSSAIFGVPPRNPVDDSVQPAPREDYGRAKLAGEELCHEYTARGLDVSIIRPRTILGHGRLGIMQVIFEWVRQGHNVPVLGKGDNVYQFVHADDLAAAAIAAAARPGAGAYNVGAAKFGTMAEALEGLVRHAGTRSRVVHLPHRPALLLMRASSEIGLAPFGPYHWLMYGESMYFDLTRTRKELGWEPKYGNVEMLCESYDWYLTHRLELEARRGTASHHRSPAHFRAINLVGRVLDLF